MLPVQVRRCKILREFTGEQQHRYFGISVNKSLHHIDTLYYSVFINEPEEVIRLQNEDALPENLLCFIQMLRDMKAYLRANPMAAVDMGELEGVVKSFSLYEFCVSRNECFDIFISSYLPNPETPRIVVQLRSRYLVLTGVKQAIEESFAYLKEFLAPFGLFPVCVRENRIDYAFHTNLIQNPYKFFSDDHLMRHLKSNLRTYAKFGRISDHGIELETLNLGNRKSNNVYFRGYNKCQEIIRMNYKAFFFQRWYDNGLISEFDKYVYEIAYEMRSYRTGCLVGRLRWYLEFGTDKELKEQCRMLLESDHIRSDNTEHLSKSLHNIIPEPTLIFNIEYQTKRKFYTTCAEWLGWHENFETQGSEKKEPSLPVHVQTIRMSDCDPLLYPLFRILSNAREIVDYLTEYGNAVSFAEDRTMSKKEFLEEGEPYQAWWRRIRSTPIEYAPPEILALYRTYDVRASFSKARRSLQGQVARLAMLANNSLEDRSFVEDMSDVLGVLNDNDVQPFVFNREVLGKKSEEDASDLRSFDPIRYAENRKRKARQLRGILPDSSNAKKSKEPIPQT